MRFGILAAAAAVIVIGAVVARRPNLAQRAPVLRLVGFIVMALSTCFVGVFIVGETLVDPGGWAAVGLLTAWAIPLAALTAISWYRPGLAVRVLVVLAMAAIGLSVWFAALPDEWRSFENRNGPIRAIVTFVLAAAITVLGLKRTAEAGLLLLVVGLVPVALSSVGTTAGLGSLVAVSAAPVLTGFLYSLSAYATRQSGGAAGVGTETMPRAA